MHLIVTVCQGIANSTGQVICSNSTDSQGYFDGDFSCYPGYTYTPGTRSKPAATCDGTCYCPLKSV